jgi:uncharacterized protein (TIGR04255 family)
VTESTRPFPSFDSPPVIETVLGLQFTPLAAFGIPHFGLYWQRIRDQYPHQQAQAALNPAEEQYGDRPPMQPFGIEFVPLPEVRCWFIDRTSTELIQVQRDRFIRNWRKTSESDVYPRYDALKPRFRDDWARFCTFLDEFGIGMPEVNQCEVTYINNFELGRELETYAEAHRVIRLLSPLVGREFLPDTEMVQMNASYLMPDKKGRLHVSLQPAIRRHDAKPLLQLTLTARGRPASSKSQELLDWFDMGHEWIVRGFVDLTTREMHQLWRRRSD